MAWEENSRICINMQLIAILSRTGVSFYNIFSAKYDNNGWAAPQFVKSGNSVKAVNEWGVRDADAAGFAVSAPFNFMAHMSIDF